MYFSFQRDDITNCFTRFHLIFGYLDWGLSLHKVKFTHSRHHLPICSRLLSTLIKWNYKVSFNHSRNEWCNLTNFYHAFLFINFPIRECNFTMETILEKGFAQALAHTSQHLCFRHSCCDLYALVLVQNPLPRSSPWQNQTFIRQFSDTYVWQQSNSMHDLFIAQPMRLKHLSWIPCVRINVSSVVEF